MVEQSETNLGSAPMTASTTVPVKLDGVTARQFLSQIAADQSAPAIVPLVNPTAQMQEMVSRLRDIYESFASLQAMGKQLHGVNKNGPLPPTLQIDDIRIKFRITSDVDGHGPREAHIKNIGCVGDLSDLLSVEMGVLIFEAQQLNARILSISQQADEHYAKARKQWEEANKDRQISISESAAEVTDEKRPV